MALGFRDAPLSSPAASRAILIASAVTAFSELFASPFGFALCASRGESACTRTLTRLTLNHLHRLMSTEDRRCISNGVVGCSTRANITGGREHFSVKLLDRFKIDWLSAVIDHLDEQIRAA